MQQHTNSRYMDEFIYKDYDHSHGWYWWCANEMAQDQFILHYRKPLGNPLPETATFYGDHFNTIKKAIEDKDAEMLGRYAQFRGKNPYTKEEDQPLIMAVNAAAWEHYKSCGFTGGYELEAKHERFFKHLDIEPTEEVWILKGKKNAKLYLAQLPNTHWIFGWDINFNPNVTMTYEWLTIFHRQYASKADAVDAGLEIIKDHLRHEPPEFRKQVEALMEEVRTECRTQLELAL